MFVVVVLLLAASVISTSTDVSFSVNQPSDAVFCAYRKQSKDMGIDVFSMIWLIYAFITKTIQVFVSEPSAPGHNRIFDRLRIRLDHKRTVRDRVLDKLEANSHQSKKLIFRANALYFAYIELSGSFSWQIIWLVYSFGYGVRISIDSWTLCYSFNRFQENQGEDPATCLTPALSMGFGQIVPLVLLILPILSFVGAFFEQEPGTRIRFHHHLRNSAHYSSDHSARSFRYQIV